MKNKTVFVIGAGSTKYLGIPTTDDQNELIYLLKKSKDENLLKLSKILNETFGENNYDINDVYNLIDSNLLLHNSLQSENEKIEYYELEKCKRDLIKYIFEHFIVNLQNKDKNDYQKLVNFYRALAEREVSEKFNSGLDFENRKFFISSYSIINYNWDLYSLLPIIEANGEINHTNGYYFATDKNPKLRIYCDFNCEYAGRTGEKNKFWYPFTESAAFSTNGTRYSTTRKVVLTKCFLPHGAMNLFKCTSCAKHSYFLGDLNLESVVERINYEDKKELYKCPYCENSIYSKDFDVLAQSNFKTRNSFLEEVRLSMTQELRTAKTLVFIGYSMPDDDVDYKTIFKSLNGNVEKVYVVLYEEKSENKFVEYSELNDDAKITSKNFNKVFGDKALYNMAGFPNAYDKILQIVK